VANARYAPDRGASPALPCRRGTRFAGVDVTLFGVARDGPFDDGMTLLLVVGSDS
jgi:hypothetical protein